MEKPLSPIFDDDGTEVSRELFWGQKELGSKIGTTSVYVGDLMRLVGLLLPDSKEPTVGALRTGAALYVTVETADGFHRYPRWRPDLVLDVLRRALQEYPKPPSRTEQASHDAKSPRTSGLSLEERVEALERRIESLERQLRRAPR